MNEVEGVVSAVTPAQADPLQPECTPADFELGGTATVNDVVPGGGGTLPWSGLTLALKNTEFNQDNCKNVTVTIDYTTT